MRDLANIHWMRVSSSAARSRSADLAVVPEMDGGDGRGHEAVEREGLVRAGRQRPRRPACSIRRWVWRKPVASTTAPASISHLAGLDLPSAIRRARDGIHAGVHAHIDAETARQLDHGLEELADRRGGNAQAAGLGRAQKRLVKDLAGVLRGTVFEAVVERAGDDRLPEVADGAVGLAGALEPCGEALRDRWLG